MASLTAAALLEALRIYMKVYIETGGTAKMIFCPAYDICRMRGFVFLKYYIKFACNFRRRMK